VTDLQGQRDLRDVERLHENDSTWFNVKCAASAKNPARQKEESTTSGFERPSVQRRKPKKDGTMRSEGENRCAAGGDRSRDPASSRVNGVEWRGIMW
jgi:hypothetical protein